MRGETVINLELEYRVFNILIFLFLLYFAVYLKIGIRKIINMEECRSVQDRLFDAILNAEQRS